MNCDFRVSIGFFDHPKTMLLESMLGLDGVCSLLRLWAFAAQHNPTGIFSNGKRKFIELAIRWKGNSGEFIQALVEIGYLDEINEGYKLHDWEHHNGYAVHAESRSERARNAAEKRWKKNGIAVSDATSSATSSASDNACGFAPSPTPLPTPIPFLNKENLSPEINTPAPTAAQPKPKKQKKTTAPDPRHSYLSHWWCWSFEAVTGSRYVYGKSDAGILKNLLNRCPFDQLLERSVAYLLLDDDKRWPAGAPTLPGLAHSINQLASKFTDVIEGRAVSLRLLAPPDVKLENFRPWEDV